MKHLVKQIKKLKEKIDAEADRRDKWYEGRSTKWQESGKGIDYDENTRRLRDCSFAMDIEMADKYTKMENEIKQENGE